MKKIITSIVVLFIFSCNDKPKQNEHENIVQVQQLQYSVQNIYPHNQTSFTEGLEWHNGFLYEGTGDTEYEGNSKLAKINLLTGNDIQKINLSKEYFGEGITLLNNKIYQLTYKEQKCFVYDAKTLKKINEFTYEGEGWGMTNNGKEIIMGNGSNNLYFRNPENFAITKTLNINNNYGPVTGLNELEYVDGFVYANVWPNYKIVKINLNTSKVAAEANLEDILHKHSPQDIERKVDVLNGIAYDSIGKRFFITGKYWSKVFEIQFN
ncbi:MAG: glutaminyl-peptide cyclotransferase [Chitinophagaceae bacterium]|nr:glutaminyl-peptide cyclotransferase [Chitinophagaceae bacterium]